MPFQSKCWNEIKVKSTDRLLIEISSKNRLFVENSLRMAIEWAVKTQFQDIRMEESGYWQRWSLALENFLKTGKADIKKAEEAARRKERQYVNILLRILHLHDYKAKGYEICRVASKDDSCKTPADTQKTVRDISKRLKQLDMPTVDLKNNIQKCLQLAEQHEKLKEPMGIYLRQITSKVELTHEAQPKSMKIVPMSAISCESDPAQHYVAERKRFEESLLEKDSANRNKFHELVDEINKIKSEGQKNASSGRAAHTRVFIENFLKEEIPHLLTLVDEAIEKYKSTGGTTFLAYPFESPVGKAVYEVILFLKREILLEYPEAFIFVDVTTLYEPELKEFNYHLPPNTGMDQKSFAVMGIPSGRCSTITAAKQTLSPQSSLATLSLCNSRASLPPIAETASSPQVSSSLLGAHAARPASP